MGVEVGVAVAVFVGVEGGVAVGVAVAVAVGVEEGIGVSDGPTVGVGVASFSAHDTEPTSIATSIITNGPIMSQRMLILPVSVVTNTWPNTYH